MLVLVATPVSGTASATETADHSQNTSVQNAAVISWQTDAVHQQDQPTENTTCRNETAVDDSIPETRDEFLATLRRMNGTAAFESYTEFEIIRSQVLLNVQAGSFETVDRRRSERVVRLLRWFTEAYACQQDGQFENAIAAANETDAVAAELATGDNGQLGVLANLALTRFNTEIGEELRSTGEGIERTPDRIEVFEMAALSFRRAGATDRFAQLSVRLDETRQVYRSDMEQYNESLSIARSFVESCGSCGSPESALIAFGPSVFDQYVAARQASAETDEAAALARKHSLEERASRADTLGSDVAATRSDLAIAAATGMIGFALVVGLLAGLVGSRLATWRRDLEESQLGNIVLVGEMLDA